MLLRLGGPVASLTDWLSRCTQIPEMRLGPRYCTQFPEFERRLYLKRIFPQAVAYDELFTGLHGDGEDTQLVCGRPADAERCGGSLDTGKDAAGIFIGLYLNPRLAPLQLLIALSHRVKLEYGGMPAA